MDSVRILSIVMDFLDCDADCKLTNWSQSSSIPDNPAVIQYNPRLYNFYTILCNLFNPSIIWGTHRRIVPKTGISWQTTWGSNPITIAKAKMTFQNGSMQGSDQPKSLSLHFHNPPQSSKIFFAIGSDCEQIMWLQQRHALILISNFTLVTIERIYFAMQSDCMRILD